MPKPIVIVGAGISGLICARTLLREGLPVLLIDAGDRPGGQLRTDSVDGFRLDRSFRFLFEAAPHLSRELHLDELEPGFFEDGLMIYGDGRLNRIEPGKWWHMLRNRYLSSRAKRELMAWRADASRSEANINSLPDMATSEHLSHGHHTYSDEILNRVIQPVFGALTFDRELAHSRKVFLHVSKMLADGREFLPADGHEAIIAQIAQDIPRHLIRTYSRVEQLVFEGARAAGVRLDTSEVYEASAVVLAVDADAAASLSGQTLDVTYQSATTIYFETPSALLEEPYLIYDGANEGPANVVAPVSQVGRRYAPAGKHLLAALIPGVSSATDPTLEQSVREQLQRWFPEKGVNMWRFIRSYPEPNYQLELKPGAMKRLPKNRSGIDGLYYCGAHTTNGTLDGAAESAQRCAKAVLADRPVAAAA